MEKKIKVQITRQENADYFKCKIGDILEIDYENLYLPGVVGSEVGNPHIEVAKAIAICARTYSYKAIVKDIPISDASSSAQAFRAYRATSKNYENAKAGVEATKGMLLFHNGKMISSCPYSHNNGGHTVSSKERWGSDRPYLISKPDPWDAAFGGVKKGHGVGGSQNGMKYAASIGITYDKMLSFYFDGTYIVDNYGVKPPVEEQPEEQPVQPYEGVNLIEEFQEKNPWFTNPRPMIPWGLLLHTTGANNPNINRYVGSDNPLIGKNKYNNHWNKSTANKCVHMFGGKLVDKTPAIVQTLPFTQKCAGVGKGPKGSYNNSHIQIELCEDSMNDEKYYRELIGMTENLFVQLCEQFNIDVENIVGHYEAHNAGYGSNHGDPSVWMKKFGDSMDKFRARIAARLDNEEPTETEDEPEEEPVASIAGKYAVVTTKYAKGVTLWKNKDKRGDNGNAQKGVVVFVKEDSGDEWVYAQFDNREGFVKKNYLSVVDIKSLPNPQYAKVETKFKKGISLWRYPNKYGGQKKVLRENSLVKIEGPFGSGWAYVSFNGVYGYADENYLTLCQPETNN